MDLDEATVSTILSESKTLSATVLKFERKGPYLKARVAVQSATGYDLAVEVTCNPVVGKISACLFVKGVKPGWARIYGVDVGDDHHNPDCQMAGDPHRHNRWSVVHGCRFASPAPEFTSVTEEMVARFLQECSITTAVQVQLP
ncbi:MAG TPA: hypothetical protein VEK07_20825 [Polyangiaceae bacterium]|nr:hypothetical protein [Polyangiaceae bacterium]